MKNNFTKKHSANLPDINVIEAIEDDKIACRFCGSKDYKTSGTQYSKKDGVSKIQQRYQCKSCGRKFVLNAKKVDIHTLEIPDTFTFDSDVWLASHLGLRVSLHVNPQQEGGRIIFSSITQNFLKLNAKRFVLYKSSTTEFTTINHDYMAAFRNFS